MNQDYEVLVIGSGTAGYTVAHSLAAAGKKTAVIDGRPFGGTCAMRGCQPKKYLVCAAEAAQAVTHLQAKGLSGQVQIDWPTLMRQKRAFTDPVPERTEKGFRNAGITPIHGFAQFVDGNSVRVGEQTLRAEHIVIATGAKPMPLPISGSDLLATSDDFLDLDRLPRSIVFVGAGYISIEFACVAAVAGAEVTILEMADWPLPMFDPDLVGELMGALAELGIDLELETPVRGIERTAQGFLVRAGEEGGEEYRAELVVHGGGRVPDLDGLDLERAGVAHSRAGVTVNEFMQSVTNPAIYCVGDVAAAPPQLAPVADMEAEVAAENILHGNRRKADHSNVPSVVFSLPPLAMVGLGEAELEKTGIDYRVNSGDASRWPNSKRIGQAHAAYKVYLEKGSEKILGAHLLGHNAGEMINVFALAMKAGLSAADLKKVLWAYPTHISDIKYMLG